MTTEQPESVREKVREGYATIARLGAWLGEQFTTEQAPKAGGCCGGGGCCGPVSLSAQELVHKIGYTEAELASSPESANMGLSCGNPTAIASLKPGEVVLDLGSGGGFDCFIAGPKVGAEGRVIGVDMTAEMISKARGNIAAYQRATGLNNVEFRLGEIEHLPAADRSVDVVISNCVINLSPDKAQVWREIARVLKPGGRVAVSDLALLKPLPHDVSQMVEALIGCVAGASLVSDIERMLNNAGFTDVALTSKPQYVAAMTNSNDPLYARIMESLPAGSAVSDFITSLDVTAVRP